MSSADVGYDARLSRVRERERIEERLLYTAAFPLFLAGTLVKRATAGTNTKRQSIFAEARAAANTCIPFVFMR